ncbi:helix-turn-helix domain-containing protein [Glutamicibacter mysorens]|uniref:helix-turn-helix domain-containing protein n=1 Tax=Glutamicibacter mysorens TaxID=257984 RepID=UPI0020C5F0F5|nr:helix-turn-helix domain-containing protein [Glutamicibacter mysorens]UTM47240.1 helix-turn-helix domain-containing protein [Glutamicibacter mysorens]
MAKPDEDPLLTVPETAERLRSHPETVRQMLRRGDLVGIKFSSARTDSAPWTVIPVADDIGLCRTQVGASIIRTALVAIQELHCENVRSSMLSLCHECLEVYPCDTRRLADQGLGDKLASTTKNGENNA